MDELQAVREHFADPAPPRPHVIASARERLAGRTPPRHRTWLRAAVPATAVAAAAAVAAAVAFGAPGTGARHQAGPGASPAARSILLTAARTVAAAPAAAAGRYWRVSDVVANVVTVGSAGRHYLIVEKVATQQWTSRNPSGLTTQYSQALSVRPASPRDQAAWRSDGAPTSWNIDQDTGLADPHGYANGFVRDIAAGRGKLMVDFVMSTGTGKTFDFGHARLSARELRALPASARALRALILGGQSAGDVTYLFQVTPSLLAMPVTPEVRAALYKMLAGLPGVRSLGRVTDPAGQPGIAVALTGRFRHCGGYLQQVPAGDRTGYRFSSCTVQQRLVIDPHSGLPLAQELRYLKLPAGQAWSAPGGLFSYQLFGSARWTNANPPHPGN